tara:strand:+ start:349 stop:699 length:351 start_codon:yes stop_codon:yes gene_type:complete
MITLNFGVPINNDSLQIGDGVYYVTSSGGGGFNSSTETPIFTGYLMEIDEDLMWIIVDEAGVPVTPSQGDFIMFAKDSSINLSGLTGYFAEVEIRNNSKVNAEMYAIGSEITVSSK